MRSREPGEQGGPPDGANHQPVAVVAELEEGPFEPADVEPLRRPHRHPEDDLAAVALDGGLVALSLLHDPEVLAHRRARAAHRVQDNPAAGAHHELLGHRPVVDGILRDAGEGLTLAQRDAGRLAAPGVLHLQRGHRVHGDGGRERRPDHQGQPKRPADVHLGFNPFSLKYFSAPGWKGMGDPPWYWFASSRFFASWCTATRSAFFSKTVLVISYASFSSIFSCTTRTFQTSATWASLSCPG